jgi:hypothetical protein
MTIICNQQEVKAGIHMESGVLNIDFMDDPSFVRAERVVVDMMQRSIGLIFQAGYHPIGNLPKNIIGNDVEKLTRARLRGQGQGGREITLHAPVKIVQV